MNVITNNDKKCTEALAALKSVLDPEIELNIVDLGLIYQLDFAETEKKIYCVMTLTTQFCPMGESITNAAKETLESHFPEHHAVIKLTFDPLWNQDMISEEGREFLNER